jgi:hypothetical protein
MGETMQTDGKAPLHEARPQLTSTLRRLVFWAIVFLVAVHLTATASVIDGPQAETTPWTESHHNELSSLFPTATSVEDFVRAVVLQAHMQDVLDVEFNQPAILDYSFIDLSADGKLELVCRLDYSGRGISLYLIAISKIGKKFHIALLDSGMEFTNLSTIVRDIGNTGRKEVVVKVPIGISRGRAAPAPYFEHIFLYEGNQFVQADTSFRGYYRDMLLPELEQNLENEQQRLQAAREAHLDRAIEYEQEKADALKESIDAVVSFLAGH